MAYPTIPKLAFPLRFNNGRAAVVEQDSQTEIEACVELCVRTVVGEREERPGFGIPDFVHRMNGVDPVVMRAYIEDAEPRARFLLESEESDLDVMISNVMIEMKAAGQDG